MPPKNNTEIVELLKALDNRLEALSEQVSLLSERPVSSGYPNRFIPPKKALEYLEDLNNIQGVYAACRAGRFKPGTELIDTSPAGSERPTYLINVYAHFERLKKEQST